MPKITPEIKQELVTLEQQIKIDLAQADKEVGLVKEHMKLALVCAWHAGKGLLAAKERIGHGGFIDWAERFKVNHSTILRYMALASNYATLQNLPTSKREAYLMMGVLPEKDGISHDGDMDLTPPPANHLQFLNRFRNWKNQVEAGKLKYDKEQAKTDLRPVYEWLKGLYGE